MPVGATVVVGAGVAVSGGTVSVALGSLVAVAEGAWVGVAVGSGVAVAGAVVSVAVGSGVEVSVAVAVGNGV